MDTVALSNAGETVLKLAVSWVPGHLEGLATVQGSHSRGGVGCVLCVAAEVQPVLGGHLGTPVRFLSKGGLAFLTEQLSLGTHTPGRRPLPARKLAALPSMREVPARLSQ